MRFRLAFLIPCSLLILAGCPKTLPAPATPVLQEVRLGAGKQECPPGGCVTLPTTSPTTWMLDPLSYGTAGNMRANRRAVIVMNTPSLTDMTVASIIDGQSTVMTALPRDAGDPGNMRDFRVSATDDGSTKTWFITVVASYCKAPVTFRFVNVGGAPSRPMSAPLDVTLTFKNPRPQVCGGFDLFAVMSPGQQSRPSITTGTPPATCPPGEQLFTFCEDCPASPGADRIPFQHSGCYASVESFRQQGFYNSNNKTNCTLIVGACP